MQTRTMLAAAMLALALTPVHRSAAQERPSDGDPARGLQLFVADGCSECHGTVGQGGPGVRLAPTPLPLSIITAYLRNPAGEMPPYTSKVISDADIRDIRAYLASVPPPPHVQDIADLN